MNSVISTNHKQKTTNHLYKLKRLLKTQSDNLPIKKNSFNFAFILKILKIKTFFIVNVKTSLHRR